MKHSEDTAKEQASLFDVEREPTSLPVVTPIMRRLVEAGTDIMTDPEDLIPSFLHAVLCQVSLPRKSTQQRVFERGSGRVQLRIEAGTSFDGMKWVDQPMPYGTRPRLVLVHLCTEAIRTGQREVEVGRSIGEFLDRLDIPRGGGPRGGYTMFRKQMQALAACNLRLSYPVAGRIANMQAPPIESFEAWIRSDSDEQMVLWPGIMTLNHQFYDSLREHAVPLDNRALAALTHSALALDLYTWLGHRLCRVRKQDGVRVPWVALKEQFGDEYNDLRNFKKAMKLALHQVLAVYPSARIEDVTGGIRLMPSPPPVVKTKILVPTRPQSA